MVWEGEVGDDLPYPDYLYYKGIKNMTKKELIKNISETNNQENFKEELTEREKIMYAMSLKNMLFLKYFDWISILYV